MKSERAPLVMLLFWLVSTLLWWAFAFAPTAASTPEWFTAAKNACFGTLHNGLPDTYGWMLLVLAPGSFLIGLFVTWFDDLKIGLRNALLNKASRILVTIALAATALEAYYVAIKIYQGLQISNYDFSSDVETDLPSTYPQTNLPAADFSLIDQHGQKISLADFKDEVVLLTFAFAHCQTVCPILVKQATEALALNNAQGARLLIITLDPWRDTPSSLPQLAEQWQLPARAHILSGDINTVLSVIKAYNIPTERNEKTGDVTHPALTYVIGKNSEIAYTFNNAPPQWLAQAVRRLNNGIARNTNN